MINHSRCIYRRRETRSSHVRDYTGLVLRSFSSLSSRLALVCVSACRVKSLPSACVVRSGRGFNYIVLSTPSLSSFSSSRSSTRRSSRWWGRRVLQALACAGVVYPGLQPAQIALRPHYTELSSSVCSVLSYSLIQAEHPFGQQAEQVPLPSFAVQPCVRVAQLTIEILRVEESHIVVVYDFLTAFNRHSQLSNFIHNSVV